MSAIAAPRVVAGLALAGVLAALAWSTSSDRPRGDRFRLAAAGTADASVQRGASGFSLQDEAIAVDAVVAHLRDARVPGRIDDVRLYPLVAAPQGIEDEVVVCGTLAVPGGAALQVVARVVLNRPSAAALRRPPMVIMEAGPGLGRGGPVDGPGLRYCRQGPAVASTEAALTRVAALSAEAKPDAVAAPVSRVVVVSPARVRAAPESQATVLGAAPRGSSYVVLSRAPGGWVQISDGEVSLGWVHGSLLQTSP